MRVCIIARTAADKTLRRARSAPARLKARDGAAPPPAFGRSGGRPQRVTRDYLLSLGHAELCNLLVYHGLRTIACAEDYHFALALLPRQPAFAPKRFHDYFGNLGWRELLAIVNEYVKKIKRSRSGILAPPGILPVIDTTYFEWACEVLQGSNLV